MAILNFHSKYIFLPNLTLTRQFLGENIEDEI